MLRNEAIRLVLRQNSPMTQSTHRISPLRQRMIDDMRMRNFSPSTQRNYIRSVRDFAAYLKRSPDQAKAEELRQYLVHLTDNGISPTSHNACLPALKFSSRRHSIGPRSSGNCVPSRHPRGCPGAQSGRGPSPAGGNNQSQAQSRLFDRLQGGPASQRSGEPQGWRHRQSAYVPAG